MPSGFHTWSQTSGTNASADSAINWAEGQAPSSINDSARAEMAVLAKWRDDNNGSLTTGGTSTSLTVTSNTGFTTLALMDKQTLAFTMNATSGAAPTLNVDGLGTKPIRNATGVTLPTGALLLGSVYHATYYNTAGEWLLHNMPGALPAGVVTTATIVDANVTLAKIVNTAASRLLGNPTGSAAAPSEISLGAGLLFSGTTLTSSAPSLPGAVGLVVTNNATTPSSKIDIAADQAIMLASGIAIFASSVSVTIDTSTTGAANGLDTGSRGNSTWYNLFLISNGTTTAGLASLSATAPTMPSGYNYMVRVGTVITDSSGNFYRTRQLGNRTQYQIVAATNTATFRSTTLGSSGYAAVSTSAFVPPTATSVKVYMESQVAGTQIHISANGNFANSIVNTMNRVFVESTATSGSGAQSDILLESSNIYVAPNGTTIVNWLGWTDKVNAS